MKWWEEPVRNTHFVSSLSFLISLIAMLPAGSFQSWTLCSDHEIFQCLKRCRNGHIDNLKKLGEKYKKKDWGWLWVEAMAQPKLEEAVSDSHVLKLLQSKMHPISFTKLLNNSVFTTIPHHTVPPAT